jgi:hypothetical protein
MSVEFATRFAWKRFTALIFVTMTTMELENTRRSATMLRKRAALRARNVTAGKHN